jgi:hypothetical protein
LVSPTGQKSSHGALRSSFAINNLTLTFDDAASNSLLGSHRSPTAFIGLPPGWPFLRFPDQRWPALVTNLSAFWYSPNVPGLYPLDDAFQFRQHRRRLDSEPLVTGPVAGAADVKLMTASDARSSPPAI